MLPHDALRSADIELLFEAAEGDGSLRVTADGVQANGQTVANAAADGVRRLQACGYVEGGPELFRITTAGREYADSMK
jgi:hypothetical protein